MRDRRRWWAAAGAGVALGIAPTSGVGAVLVLVALVASAASIEGHPGRDAARGLLVGALWYGLALSWLPDAWTRFTGGPAPLPYVALLALQAAVPTLVHAAAGLARSRGMPVSALGLAWAAGEGAAMWIQPLHGGPSLWLAATPLGWPAAVGGRVLLSGLAAGWAGLAVARPRWGVVTGIAWALVGLGWYALPDPDGPVTRVGVVQPGTGAFDGRRASTAPARADKLLGLVDALPDVDWVATPEGAWPHDPGDGPGARRDAFLAAWGARPPAVVGATVGRGKTATNSLLVVEGGRVADRYDKRALVPIAEVRALGLGRDRYRVGDGPPALRIGGVRVGPLICYEDVPASGPRQAARAGAQVLLAPTNDGWPGPGRGAAQHLATARLAAVEAGRYVIRPASNGISAVVDPRGRVRWSAPWVDGDRSPDAPGHAHVVDVPLLAPRLSGAQVAPWLAWAAALWLAARSLLRGGRPRPLLRRSRRTRSGSRG